MTVFVNGNKFHLYINKKILLTYKKCVKRFLFQVFRVPAQKVQNIFTKCHCIKNLTSSTVDEVRFRVKSLHCKKCKFLYQEFILQYVVAHERKLQKR